MSWQDFVKASYDLVMESEGLAKTFLDDEVENYVVHLLAKNFVKLQINEEAIAIQILSGNNYQYIGDECLLINSYPLRRKRWPSDTYYRDMGTIAYGMACIPKMETNFDSASKVLHTVFCRKV
jgi:hypothetical protein